MNVETPAAILTIRESFTRLTWMPVRTLAMGALRPVHATLHKLLVSLFMGDKK